jgi:hypothetical protein
LEVKLCQSHECLKEEKSPRETEAAELWQPGWQNRKQTQQDYRSAPDTDKMHNSEKAANTEGYFGSLWLCQDRKLQTNGKEKVKLLFWQMFPTLLVALAWVTATEIWQW